VTVEVTTGPLEPPVARWRASWSMLVALLVGCVLGFGLAMWLLLEGYITDLGPPQVVNLTVLALAAIAYVIGLGRILVRAVEVDAAGMKTYRTYLRRRVPLAADDPMGLDPLAGYLVIESPAGTLVLTPDLARDESLLAHLDAHPGSSDELGKLDGESWPLPEPVPRERLVTSAWRIVRTSSFTFSLTLHGACATVLLLVMWLFVFPMGSEAIRPDSGPRSASELLVILATTSLLPLVTIAPVVLLGIARWRTILKTGEPVQGRIDSVDRHRGEILVRYSSETEGAGPRHRKKIMVRPTAEAKALKPGPEIAWVMPGKPRRALPQGLFVAEGGVRGADGPA
jgi:hypothetical protein